MLCPEKQDKALLLLLCYQMSHLPWKMWRVFWDSGAVLKQDALICNLGRSKWFPCAGTNFCLSDFLNTLPKFSAAPENSPAKSTLFRLSSRCFGNFTLLSKFFYHYLCILLSAHFITFVLINPSNLTTINLSILKSLDIFHLLLNTLGIINVTWCKSINEILPFI